VSNLFGACFDGWLFTKTVFIVPLYRAFSKTKITQHLIMTSATANSGAFLTSL